MTYLAYYIGKILSNEGGVNMTPAYVVRLAKQVCEEAGIDPNKEVKE